MSVTLEGSMGIVMGIVKDSGLVKDKNSMASN